MGSFIIFTLSILYDELPATNDTVQNFRTGYMLDGVAGGAVVFEGNVSKIKCKQAQINGASVLPISYRIWYR